MPPLGLLTGLLFLIYALTYISKHRLRRAKPTALNGPTNPSFLFGWLKTLEEAVDTTPFYEKWASTFGLVYRLPMAFGTEKVIVMDPKAVAHIYAKDTVGYNQPMERRLTFHQFVGPSILTAEGHDHKRQRKALTPGFTNSALREITPVFFDTVYKLKTAWDPLFQSSDNIVVDVATWMSRASIDSIGLAGFDHDFGSLSNQRSSVGDIFDAFAYLKMTAASLAQFLIAPGVPVVLHIPTQRTALLARFRHTTDTVTKSLLAKGAEEANHSVKDIKNDKSVLGLLVKAQTAGAGSRLSGKEIMGQIRLLIFAGYETTSITMTWALIELAQHPDCQKRLRDELSAQFSNADPTWDELTYGCPYLDAVVHETLRTHPVAQETSRQAVEDDILPLSTPIVTASGKTMDHVHIAKGTLLTVATKAIQNSSFVWGDDCKEFKPERWLDGGKGLSDKAKEVRGHRHLFTFVDGPRTCLGKSFAISEFKAIFSVLIRNYSFELRDGPGTKIGNHRGVGLRPKVVGEKGLEVPMVVRKIA